VRGLDGVIFAVGLAFLNTAAMAQTTTTNCAVYGNQADCQSTTPTSAWDDFARAQAQQAQLQAQEAQEAADRRQRDQDFDQVLRKSKEESIATLISIGQCWGAKQEAQGDLDLMAKVAALCH
jgi:hypothetical protein